MLYTCKLDWILNSSSFLKCLATLLQTGVSNFAALEISLEGTMLGPPHYPDGSPTSRTRTWGAQPTAEEGFTWHLVLTKHWRPPSQTDQEETPLTSEADSSPRMTGPDLIASSHCCCLLYLLPFFPGRTMPLSAFPTSDCWIRHQKPQSIQESNDPFAHPIRNSTGISDTVVCLNCSAGPFCQVRVLSPPKLMPCFNFTQPWEVKTRSFEYLYEKFFGAATVTLAICKFLDIPRQPLSM